MTDPSAGTPKLLPLPEAAEILALPATAVEGLARAGYLTPACVGPEGPLFRAGDVKAFVARNDDNGSGNLLFSEPAGVDVSDLLEALDGRSEQMARAAYEVYSTVFPETRQWDSAERARFVDQAKSRFEAILAVASQGAEVDDALTGDLREVGATAAWAGSPLPQLLVVLRISRDVVVQTAVEVAEERGRHWSVPLALLLTRVLPAMDRLTDSLAQGYWAAVVGREAEHKARYQHVVEHSSDGVYEVDLDGRLQYANASLAAILGRLRIDLDNALITDVIKPEGGSIALEPLISEPAGRGRRLDLVVLRPDGERRILEVRTTVRHRLGVTVGFQGMVRDVTVARDLEAEKNEFLALITYDLRQPLATILGLSATLESHGPEVPAERIRRMGAAVRLQAERISRMADDLYDISRLESQSLLLDLRPVDLASAAEGALGTVQQAGSVQLNVPAGVHVMADPRRLEQIIANLIENALAYGAPPVEMRVSEPGKDGSLELAIIDHGDGVPSEIVPSLFNRLRLLSRERDRSRGTGLGLTLVKGLVEAMGGRVWYEQVPGGGADFRLRLPVPREPAAPG